MRASDAVLDGGAGRSHDDHGAVLGVLGLVLMAAVPLLLALPMPRRIPSSARVAIPAQRSASVDRAAA